MLVARAWTLTVLFLAAAPHVSAQVVDRTGVPYRLWDVHGSFGLHVIAADDIGIEGRAGSRDDVTAAPAFLLDIGRYWNSHLKTEVGVQLRPDIREYGGASIRLPSGQVASGLVETRTALTLASGAVTWQFLDNTFAHPYLSGGLRVIHADAHIQREPTAWLNGGGRFVQVEVPPDESRRTRVLVRPFAAFGFKSYFNERVFVRPEISAAASGRGVGQLTVRLGFGVDL